MPDNYQERKQRKIDSLINRASKAEVNANSLTEKGMNMIHQIPFGQPILVGHYSEKWDRNFRKRAGRYIEKGADEHKKAIYYRDRAEAKINNEAISSDDPEVIIKLKEKLNNLEKKRSDMKALNKAWKKFSDKGITTDLNKLGLSDEQINNLKLKFDNLCSWERVPHPKWEIANIGQNILSVKKRIESEINKQKYLSNPETIFHIKGNNCEAIDNVEENRTQIIFNSKPSYDVIIELKKSGFHWSPTNKAWQRFISNQAHYQAQRIIEKFNL